MSCGSRHTVVGPFQMNVQRSALTEPEILHVRMANAAAALSALRPVSRYQTVVQRRSQMASVISEW